MAHGGRHLVQGDLSTDEVYVHESKKPNKLDVD